MSSNEQNNGGGLQGTPQGDGKDTASTRMSTSVPAAGEERLKTGDADKSSAESGTAEPGAEKKDAADKGAGDKGTGGGGTPVAKPPVIRQPVYRRPDSEDQPLRPHYVRPEAALLHGSPRVLMTPDAYKAMCLYVEIGPLEVGWQGTVSRTPKGDFIIEKTYLLDQDVTGVETELSADARFKLAFELSEKGDDGIDEANRMRFWGHSHVRMGTGPSGTDERTMEQFEREGCPWYVRGIFNKLGRGSFTIFLYEQGFRINDAPWAVIDPATQQVILDRPSFASGGNYGGGWMSSWGQKPVAEADKTPSLPPVPGTTTGGSVAQPKGKRAPHWLPEILVPSAELRAAIAAEYKAKVRERRGFSGWVRSIQANNNPANAGANPSGTTSGDEATNAAIAQMEAQYGTGAMPGGNEPAGDGAPVGDGKTGTGEPSRISGGQPSGGRRDESSPHVDASGRVDLSGSWVPTDTSSAARPLSITQTGHYVRIELVGRGGERPESLTGAYLDAVFMVDGWVSATSPDIGNMEIKVEVVNPNLIRLEGADRFYAGVYRRSERAQSGPGIGEQIIGFFKDIFTGKSS